MAFIFSKINIAPKSMTIAFIMGKYGKIVSSMALR